MKFSIRAKIFLAFSLGLASLLLFLFAVLASNDDARKRLDTMDTLGDARSLVQDLQLQTASIWQFVTDACLTRDLSALNQEAKAAFDQAQNDVKQLQTLQVLPNQARLLEPLEGQLEAFWAAGQTMYAAYGLSKTEGDAKMRIFDEAGSQLVDGFQGLQTPAVNLQDGLLKSAKDATTQNAWIFGGVGFAMTVLMIVLGFLLSRIISTPIQRAAKTLQTLANSQGDLTLRLQVSGSDETAALSSSVNGFLEKIHSILLAIESLIRRNQNLSTALNQSSQESATAVSDLTTKLGELRSRIQSLDLDIAGASAAIEEIMANIVSLAHQIQNQDTMVSRSGMAVQQMMASITGVAEMAESKVASVGHLVELTQQGGERVRKTNQVIGKVAENADAMLGLIDLINDISDRTNLLAMNASIEAAHAGAAGRGFAVVANEIRKLATDTGANAQKIGQSLKDTEDHIRQAQADGMATQEAFHLLESEVTDFANAMKDVNESMAAMSEGGIEIIAATAELIQTSQVISNSSQEMDYGAKEILTAVHHVREVSAASLDDVSVVDALAGTLNRTALRVSAFGNQNRYNNTVLFGEVAKFQLGTDLAARDEAVALGIDWNDLLSVGIDAMDDEHKELFRRINALLVSLLGPEQGADVPRLVAAIREYAEFHFTDEEKLLRAEKYPRVDQHHLLHESFLKEFRSIETTLLTEGLTAGNLIRVQDKVVNWLLDHIAKVDHDYGEFLAQKE